MIGFGERRSAEAYRAQSEARQQRELYETNLYDLWATREAEREGDDTGPAVEALDAYLDAVRPQVDAYLERLGVGPLDEDTALTYNDRVAGAKFSHQGGIEVGYPGPGMAEHVLHPVPLRDIIAHEAVHHLNREHLADAWDSRSTAADEAIAQYVTLGAVEDLSDETTRKWFHRNRFETYLERWKGGIACGVHPQLYHAAASHISERLRDVDGDSEDVVRWMLGNRETLIDEIEAMDVLKYPE